MDGSELVVRVRSRSSGQLGIAVKVTTSSHFIDVIWQTGPWKGILESGMSIRRVNFCIPARTAPLTVEQHMRHDIGYYVG